MVDEWEELLEGIDDPELIERIKAKFSDKDKAAAGEIRKRDRLLKLQDAEFTKDFPRTAKAIKEQLLDLPSAEKDEDWIEALKHEEDKMVRLGVPDPTTPPAAEKVEGAESPAAAWGSPPAIQPIADDAAAKSTLKTALDQGDMDTVFVTLEKLNKRSTPRGRDIIRELTDERGDYRPIA
jgi:hypothetical protein